MTIFATRTLPMACPNPVCQEHGATVDVDHVPERRARGWTYTIAGDPPTCDTCHTELEHR